MYVCTHTDAKYAGAVKQLEGLSTQLSIDGGETRVSLARMEAEVYITYRHAYMHAYTHAYIRVRVRMYVCMYVCGGSREARYPYVYVCMYVCMYVCGGSREARYLDQTTVCTMLLVPSYVTSILCKYIM